MSVGDTLRAMNYDAVYEQHSKLSASSARAILPLVLDDIHTIVDVGCGIGTWAKTAQELGVEVLGLDGEWVKDPLINNFQTVDLSQPFKLDRRFDLAISMEVGEHLAPERGPGFVADLVALADRVLFSAAIPGQGGHEHTNEQWPDYWWKLFRQHGYEPQDVVRPKVWYDDTVAAWYAQNAFLYVRDAPAVEMMPARVVHPRLYEWSRSMPPNLAPDPTLRQFPAALRRAIRHRLA